MVDLTKENLSRAMLPLIKSENPEDGQIYSKTVNYAWDVAQIIHAHADEHDRKLQPAIDTAFLSVVKVLSLLFGTYVHIVENQCEVCPLTKCPLNPARPLPEGGAVGVA